ncbi:MAG: phage head-tail adaptor [Hyphomicrobiales bacterium]|nr:phage head-tail adaptor [Hyphomicrobiales bacterium]
MPPAGNLRDRVRFEARAVVGDDYGNPGAGDFEAQFSRSVEIKPMRGGEDILAARIQGTQPILIRTRYDSQTARITPEWRAIDVRDGTVYAIRTAVDMDRRHEWIELMAIAGIAA